MLSIEFVGPYAQIYDVLQGDLSELHDVHTVYIGIDDQ